MLALAPAAACMLCRDGHLWQLHCSSYACLAVLRRRSMLMGTTEVQACPHELGKQAPWSYTLWRFARAQMELGRTMAWGVGLELGLSGLQDAGRRIHSSSAATCSAHAMRSAQLGAYGSPALYHEYSACWQGACRGAAPAELLLLSLQ